MSALADPKSLVKCKMCETEVQALTFKYIFSWPQPGTSSKETLSFGDINTHLKFTKHVYMHSLICSSLKPCGEDTIYILWIRKGNLSLQELPQVTYVAKDRAEIEPSSSNS